MRFFIGASLQATVATLAIGVLLVPLDADASPWTLPEGTVAISVGSEFTWASEEWLPDGTFQQYPLDGEFSGFRLRVGGRVGLTDSTELAASLAFMQNNFRASPFVLAAELDPEASFDDVRDSVINVSDQDRGVGDVTVHLRQRFVTQRFWLTTGELELRVPTRYGRPTGTFRNDDPSQGVGNTVPLGDGRVAVGGHLLFGFVPTAGMYIRQDLGVRYRFEGPAPQAVGALKVGQRISPAIVPWIQLDGVWAIGEGESVGLSFVTDQPGQPASRFDITTIDTIERTWDERLARLGAGTTFTLGILSVDAGYYYTLIGRNTARSHTLTTSANFLVGP